MTIQISIQPLARKARHVPIEMGAWTYDLAASLATISDNDIDSCLGLFRDELLACLGLLLLLPPPSCEDEGGGGTKPKGLLLSKVAIGSP